MEIKKTMCLLGYKFYLNIPIIYLVVPNIIFIDEIIEEDAIKLARLNWHLDETDRFAVFCVV
jgi:hypothetical protein